MKVIEAQKLVMWNKYDNGTENKVNMIRSSLFLVFYLNKILSIVCPIGAHFNDNSS